MKTEAEIRERLAASNEELEDLLNSDEPIDDDEIHDLESYIAALEWVLE